MILYGRNLSPYVRRIAIWMTLQGRAFERREISIVDDAEAVLAANPMRRVPVLELDDGTKLIETWAICDWLEDTAPAARRLLPETGPARRDALQRVARAHATTEKIVALVYDKNRRPEALHHVPWIERLEDQIRAGFAEIEAVAPEDGWSGADGPDGGDVAAIVARDMAAATNPYLLDAVGPKLAALRDRAQAIPVFPETMP